MARHCRGRRACLQQPRPKIARMLMKTTNFQQAKESTHITLLCECRATLHIRQRRKVGYFLNDD